MAAAVKVTVKEQLGAQYEFEVYPRCAAYKARQGSPWIKCNLFERLQGSRGGVYAV